MKIKVGSLRRIIREEAVAPAAPQDNSGGGIAKLLDTVATQFVSKMKATYPTAEEMIQQEANELKITLTAQIKASAAKVKMHAVKSS